VNCYTCTVNGAKFVTSGCAWCGTYCSSPIVTCSSAQPAVVNYTNCAVAPPVFVPPPCPDDCGNNSAIGMCVNGTCICAKGYQGFNCLGGSGANVAEAAGIGTGAIVGIVLACIVALILISIFGKKSYDFALASQQANSTLHENPMYKEKHQEHTSQLYTGKEGQ